jgi:hypothetical protein
MGFIIEFDIPGVQSESNFRQAGRKKAEGRGQKAETKEIRNKKGNSAMARLYDRSAFCLLPSAFCPLPSAFCL